MSNTEIGNWLADEARRVRKDIKPFEETYSAGWNAGYIAACQRAILKIQGKLK